MLARALRANALRAAAGAAVAVATSLAPPRPRRTSALRNRRRRRVARLQAAVPPVGTRNWDDLKLTSRQVAKELGHEWSSNFDYAANIRKLFAEHTDVPETEVDVLVAQSDDLPKLYRQSYAKHAWGGASVRYIVLVRHGQYDEQRALQKAIKKEIGPQATDLDEMLQKDSWERINAGQVLTALGRQQATATGKLLARMLAPALDPEREGDVRIHTSTMTRARDGGTHRRRAAAARAPLAAREPRASRPPSTSRAVLCHAARRPSARGWRRRTAAFYRSPRGGGRRSPRRPSTTEAAAAGGGAAAEEEGGSSVVLIPVAGRLPPCPRPPARAEQAVPPRVRRRVCHANSPVLCAARAPAAAGGVAPPRLVQRQLRAAASRRSRAPSASRASATSATWRRRRRSGWRRGWSTFR